MASSEHNIGKRLNEEWGVYAKHALYRENGTWYHNLKRFPGALFDAQGYIVFPTELDYRECKHLQIGKQLSIPHGIAKIPGYIQVFNDDISNNTKKESTKQSTPTEEIQHLEEEIKILAGKSQNQKGQGINISAEYRTLIEQEAMSIAIDHLLYKYLVDGDWEIFDVSTTESYDLLCKRKDKPQEIHVEVKGTTSNGMEVILTPNEVRHAQANYPNTGLIIVSNLTISHDSSGVPIAQGGQIRLIFPWRPHEEHLTPMSYRYSIPTN